MLWDVVVAAHAQKPQRLIGVDLLMALVTEFGGSVHGSAALGRPVEFHARCKIMFEVRLICVPTSA
jgi:hypothetical protein